jgi:hypothetical protein
MGESSGREGDGERQEKKKWSKILAGNIRIVELCLFKLLCVLDVIMESSS